jgi:hypothetical protein
MGHCPDSAIIRQFSGKSLLRIAGLESTREGREVISELTGEFEVGAN